MFICLLISILQLIAEAIKYGDRHRPTMEMASFWLTEKQLVHKLFKVSFFTAVFVDCVITYFYVKVIIGFYSFFFL